MKRTLFFLIAFIVLCSSKCKEDPVPPDPNPTPTTEEPTDEISCLINGKEWKTGPPFLLSNPLTEVRITEYKDTNIATWYILDILASKKANIGYQYLSISCLYDTTKIGIFKPIFNANSYYDKTSLSIENRLDTFFNNWVRVNSIDTKKQFIKGEFSLRVLGKEKNDTINITNGKFNCRYQFFK